MPPSAHESAPVGYLRLIGEYGLRVPRPRHGSYLASGGTRRTRIDGDVVTDTYPPQFRPGDGFGGQLAFALKHDGVDLRVLASLFEVVDPAEVEQMVRDTPTGKYARRAWFLFEFLTGRRLSLPDLDRGTYVDVLDAGDHYTAPRLRVARQRINDNLLGDARFCPVVRRTPALAAFERARLDERCREVLERHPPDLLRRAVAYLYQKETKSSFAIERETPSSTRAERFMAALARAGREDFVRESALVDLQNRIVDPRFAESGYRASQNYVGETLGWGDERVHYVCPKPGDVRGLMEGLFAAHARMDESATEGSAAVPAIVHAAAVAFGFVFVHPFEDGNGRIHRFLIHNVLARRGFTPPGLVVPVSAAMLADPAGYDASLEAFGRPLLRVIDYELDATGRMTVAGGTADFYRFPDLTPQAEALARFVERAINDDLLKEIDFLLRHDAARAAVAEIVDLPDRLLELLLRVAAQNGGRLSRAKRERHFPMLSDDEVARIDAALADLLAPAG